MTLVIASQMEEVFNEQLRAHGSGPTVISVPEERPWDPRLSPAPPSGPGA